MIAMLKDLKDAWVVLSIIPLFNSPVSSLETRCILENTSKNNCKIMKQTKKTVKYIVQKKKTKNFPEIKELNLHFEKGCFRENWPRLAAWHILVNLWKNWIKENFGHSRGNAKSFVRAKGQIGFTYFPTNIQDYQTMKKHTQRKKKCSEEYEHV